MLIWLSICPNRVIQIVPRRDAVEIRRILFGERGEIYAVSMRVVQKVAFDPPNFVEHLLPFGARLDPDLHILNFQLPVAGLYRRRSGSDRPVVALLVQNFLAIERNGEVLNSR